MTAVDQDPVTKGSRQYWVRQRSDIDGPYEVQAGQGLKVGLHTPTILGGNSYLSWFYDRGAIKDTAHTGTSKGLSRAINRGPIKKFLPKYANVYVTIQNHGLSAGAQTHYVTTDGVSNGPRYRRTIVLASISPADSSITRHQWSGMLEGCSVNFPRVKTDKV